MRKSKYQELMAICYQIAGAIILLEGDERKADIAKDEELLLNTLSRPEGHGAKILLNYDGPYHDVRDAALEAEKCGDPECWCRNEIP